MTMPTRTAEVTLAVEGFGAGYLRGRHVVDDVTFRLVRRQALAVLGPNGAGKSTLLRGIVGLTPRTVGSVTGPDGIELNGRPGHRRARAGISYVPEGRGILNSLTVLENLRVGAEGAGKRALRGRGFVQELERLVELFPVIGDRLREPAGLLSGGEQQMVALARALISRPAVLLLDEPSLGLAPQLLDVVADLVRKVRDEYDLALLLVEQNLAFARTCGVDEALVLRRGRIVERTRLEALTAEDGTNVYFGGSTS